MARTTAIPHVATSEPSLMATSRFGETVPPVSTDQTTRLAWLTQSLQSGLTFLKGQSSYSFIDTAVNLILGKLEDEGLTKKMSKARVNHLKRQVREIIASQTNLNPQIKYETSMSDQVALEITGKLNARLKSWWRGRAFPIRSIKEALQHASTGTGYVHLAWERGLFGSDEEDVGTRSLGPMEVIPDGMGRPWDLQKAYAVHVLLAEPTVRAKQLWRLQASHIFSNRFPHANEGKAVAGSNFLSRAFQSTLFSALYSKPADSKDSSGTTAPFPETDIFWTYIRDDSYNATGQDLDSDIICETDEDHRPYGTTYYYTIPSYTPGGEYTREECAMYPTRRLIIWTRNHILYDGPSFWWHGRVPVTKFSMDEWVWEYLGSNVVEENRATQASFTSILRYFLDTLALRLDPPTKWHDKEFSPKDVERFKMRSPGERIRFSGLYPDPVSTILPYQIYEPSPQTLGALSFMIERMNHMLGVNDFQALAKLQQIPSAEGIDKILHSLSAVMTDYALSTERSLTETGYQFMWLVLQFDTARRRLQSEGIAGLTSTDFEWVPGMMIPAQIPGESDFVNSSDFHRALAWGKKFRFAIEPLSSFAITDAQQKLLLFQLYREPNFPMDPKTLAERWGLSGFGEIPGDTIIERWANWQRMKAPFLAQLQAETMTIAAQGQAQAQIAAQKTMMEAQAQMQNGGQGLSPEQQALMALAQMSGDPSLIEYAQQMLQQGGMGGAGGITPNTTPFQPAPLSGVDVGGTEALPATNRVGRPPSGNELPRIEMKDGGTRSTIAES